MQKLSNLTDVNQRKLLLSRKNIIAIIYDSKTSYYVLWLNDEKIYQGDNREMLLEFLEAIYKSNPDSKIVVNDPNMILDYEL